jgi:hypothetical protein
MAVTQSIATVPEAQDQHPTFGNWMVIGSAVKDETGHRRLPCRCLCGREQIVRADILLKGTSTSCGCARNKHPTRGHSRSRVYRIWWGMITRCRYPSVKAYKNYGGRGIKVVRRWTGRNGFSNFLTDMGEPPDGMTLERKKNSGYYSPGNCCWATRAEQARNTRQNHWLTFQGRTQCLSDWARELGMRRLTLYQRLKWGWPIDQAMTTPVRSWH